MVENEQPAVMSCSQKKYAWISEHDMLIAEVPARSLGTGNEPRHAVAMKKRVLCLYRPESVHPPSAVIAGSPGIEAADYASLDEARRIIIGFLVGF